MAGIEGKSPDAWRMLEDYEAAIYDDDVPPDGEPGYLLQVRLQSHRHYESFTFWREHPASNWLPIWNLIKTELLYHMDI